jgi:hypothetical protein
VDFDRQVTPCGVVAKYNGRAIDENLELNHQVVNSNLND